jgi:hypothetical protein
VLYVMDEECGDEVDCDGSGSGGHGGIVHAAKLNVVLEAGETIVVVIEAGVMGVSGVYLVTAEVGDGDGDGSDEDVDCDDADPSALPGATEVCDGVDNDCDGYTDEGTGWTYFTDADHDGYGVDSSEYFSCLAPSRVDDVMVGGDCHDNNDNVYPGATSYHTDPYTYLVWDGGIIGGGMALVESWDYNCDGVEMKQWTESTTSSCNEWRVSADMGCSGDFDVNEWEGSSVPDCGEIATFFEWCEENASAGACVWDDHRFESAQSCR